MDREACRLLRCAEGLIRAAVASLEAGRQVRQNTKAGAATDAEDEQSGLLGAPVAEHDGAKHPKVVQSKHAKKRAEEGIQGDGRGEED